LLTVAAAEAKDTVITVTATSTYDTTKAGEAKVTVTDVPPEVTGVTVTPAIVAKGKTKTLVAEVEGSPNQAVKWSIETTGTASGTTINETSGLLTVAAGETKTSITVKATSVEAPAVSGTAKITISVDLGLEFTASNGDTQKGWCSDGTDDKETNLTVEDLIAGGVGVRVNQMEFLVTMALLMLIKARR